MLITCINSASKTENHHNSNRMHNKRNWWIRKLAKMREEGKEIEMKKKNNQKTNQPKWRETPKICE